MHILITFSLKMKLVLLSPCIYLLFYFVARPKIRRWFSQWPLLGIPAGMLLGSLFFSWVIWLLAHFKFPLNTVTLWSALLMLAGLSSLYSFYTRSERKVSLAQIKDEAVTLLVCFFAFIILDSLYLTLRQYNADYVGLEKFPDLAFFTSAYKSESLPPLDPFAAGERINYYYFGHFQAALMAHLNGVWPYEFLHTQVGNLFALSALILFTVGGFLFRWATDCAKPSAVAAAGLLSVIFGIFSGNLQPFFEKIVLRNPNYFYPSATRYIENVIHEFPYYSFLVGDLHGHLMNLPNAVLAVGLCALLFAQVQRAEWRIKNLKDPACVSILAFVAFSAGTSYVTNAWDILTTLLLAGFAMVAAAISAKCLWKQRTFSFLTAASALLTLGAILFYLPYWMHFSPPSQGPGLVPPDKSTPFGQLVLIWGVHLPFAIAALPLVRHSFVRAISSLGLLFIFLLEFVYFKDIYPTHFRANTVFKIGFQVWLWLSLVSAVAIVHVYVSPAISRVTKRVLAVLAAALVGCGAYYTVIALPQALFEFGGVFSLDGRDFLRRSAPEEIRLIDWINEHIQGQTVIFEAAGDSFSEFGRVAAFTGNQTIIQWSIHEWLWRGSYDRPFKPVSALQRQGYQDTVANRVADANAFFEAQDPAAAKFVLDKYNVQYFVIGRKEREKYPNLKEEMYAQLGEPVFTEGAVTLYKVKR